VYCEQTDIGRRRANNQDSLAVVPPVSPQQYQSRGWLLLVADGMGAHVAAERASKIAAEQVPLIYEKNAQRSPPLALLRGLEQANTEINLRGRRQPEYLGMGTTCTTLVLVPRGVLVGHVGDSRAYRLRGTTLDQLTRDHSAVWELESQGGLTREQAERTVGKNVITRSMGPMPASRSTSKGRTRSSRGMCTSSAATAYRGRWPTRRSGCFSRNSRRAMPVRRSSA
jgi:protein phosphatase